MFMRFLTLVRYTCICILVFVNIYICMHVYFNFQMRVCVYVFCLFVYVLPDLVGTVLGGYPSRSFGL